jgi:hypothetical protein
VDALAFVVFLEFGTEPPCLHADHRFDARIVIRRTIKNLGADYALFHAVPPSRERPFDNQAQKLPHARGVDKTRAGQGFLELIAD